MPDERDANSSLDAAMTVTITKPATQYIADLAKHLTQIRNDLMASAGESMHEALAEGVETGHARIELATTKTGDARAARGEGFPGRIVDGDFIDGFTSDSYQVNPDHLQARLGWIGEEGTPIYYDVQENGSESENVGAVHALFDAGQVAAESFKEHLQEYHDRNFA